MKFYNETLTTVDSIDYMENCAFEKDNIRDQISMLILKTRLVFRTSCASDISGAVVFLTDLGAIVTILPVQLYWCEK